MRLIGLAVCPALLMAVLALLAGGCMNARMVLSLTGRVLDADTQAPVAGAVVDIARGLCCGIVDCNLATLPRVEATTDAAGSFRLPGGLLWFPPPCFGTVRKDHLSVLAVGYQIRSFLSGYGVTGDWIESGPVLLDRVRYATEVEFWLDPSRSDTWLLDRGPRWRAAVAAVRGARLAALTAPGVFQSEPGAVFDQILVLGLHGPRAAQPSAILARDRRTGIIRAWDPRGDSVGLGLDDGRPQALAGGDLNLVRPLIGVGGDVLAPESKRLTTNGRGLAFDGWYRFSEPLGRIIEVFVSAIARRVLALDADGGGATLYEAIVDGNRVIVPGPPRVVARASGRALFGVESARIQCATAGPNPLVVGQGPAGVVIARMEVSGSLSTTSLRLAADVPSGTITACASDGWKLFVAIAGRGIHAFELSGNDLHAVKGYWGRLPLVPGERPIPTTFVALAAMREAGPALVYAVAEDSAVYRFSTSGLPEQRIEFREERRAVR